MSAGRRLVRALESSASAAGCAVRVTAEERPWCSATFVGARHAVTIEGGPAVCHWLTELSGDALSVPGHVVAELVVRPVQGGAMLHALTLEC